MTIPFCNGVRCCLISLAGLVGFVSQAQSATNNPNPAVVPVDAKPFGLTYGEWSAKFWQWEFSLPVDNHPLFLDGAVDCSAGQSGPVWFTGGTFTTTPFAPGVTLGQANRTCTIPSNKAIFFPIVNAECSTVPGDNLDDVSENGLRQCAVSFADLINFDPSKLKASVDGIPINNLAQYRVQSPLFQLGPLPANNIFQSFGLDGRPGQSYNSVSDGVHLMLYPLSPGLHTVKFQGEIDNTDGSQFIEDITYHLNVIPAPNLVITNYRLVSPQAAGGRLLLTYRADVVNSGPAFSGLSATLTNLDPFKVRALPGQNTLNFGSSPNLSQVTSSNAFTVQVDSAVPFDPNTLQWTFQTAAPGPVANPGPNQTVKVGSTVILDGRGSTNPSGTGSLTYSWVFKSRPPGITTKLFYESSAMPMFLADVAGNYVITLTVSNGGSSTSTDVTVAALP